MTPAEPVDINGERQAAGGRVYDGDKAKPALGRCREEGRIDGERQRGSRGVQGG